MNKSIPVLIIIFKRPDLTEKLINRLREANIKELYVFADGPRNESEKNKCDETRAEIEKIDWDCKVYENYSDINLGCGKGPETAISWFFNNVESGVVLEDDCLPDISFFSFCSEVLEKYKNDYQVMFVNGSNFTAKNYTSNTYRFSHLFNTTGWASWARAWRLYDNQMKGFNSLRSINEFSRLFPDNYKYFMPLLQNVFDNKEKINDVWDVFWATSCHINMGISIQPEVNLVTNIGFGREDSTHTKEIEEKRIVKSGKFKFPIQHPENRYINKIIDSQVVRLTHTN